jgi:hypothetical protein
MKIRSTSRSAFTYLTVVVTMIVVGVMLAAYLKLVGVQNYLTMRSQTWNRCVPVIEAGIEEAMAHLNRNASPDPSSGIFDLSNLGTDDWGGSAAGGWSKYGKIGKDYYFVTISPWTASGGLTPSNFPSIYCTGIVEQLPTFTLQSRGGVFVADIIQDLLGSGKYSQRSVQCTTTNVPVFTKALVAKKGIDMSGQNVRTDSFDSGDPRYHDGWGHYTNTPGKWKCNGDIASNDTITNAVCIGNANIYGKVATGPYGTVCVGVSGMIGDIAFQDDSANRGKIQSGWSTDDMNIEFPSVVVPAVSWMPPASVKYTNNTGDVYDLYLRGNSSPTNPTYIKLSGDFTANTYVEGHVCLLVQSGNRIAIGGSDAIRIGTNSSLRLYADCATAAIGGKGVQNDGIATQFYYFGTDKNTSLAYGGNAAFTGVFYAPNAALTLSGGGGAPLDFSGSAIARTIKLTGNFTFHYDENLRRVGLYRGYVITSWNEKKS